MDFFITLEYFVENFTCNGIDVEVIDHYTGEVYTCFNTDDICEGDCVFGGTRFFVEFVRPKDNKLIIEVIDPYEEYKPENDPTKW